MQFEEISATINNCGERGPQGPQGPQGLSDLSNFIQTPINLKSLWDHDEDQSSHILLKTGGYDDADAEHAQLLLEGDGAQLESVNEYSPGATALTLNPNGIYSRVLSYPSYESATMNFENNGLRLKVYSQDPISYETLKHEYKFEEGFGTVRNFDTGAYRVLNLRAGSQDPEQKLETWYPQASWPTGMAYLNTTTNGLFFLGGITEEYDPDYGETFAIFDWQKLPAVKLLWENSDPTATFAGQDITLSDSLANYRWFLIESGTVANNMTIVQHSGIFRTDFDMAAGAISSINSSATKVQLMTRNVGKTSDTKIHIYDGTMNEVVLATGVWTQQSNSGILKPLRVFGIK